MNRTFGHQIPSPAPHCEDGELCVCEKKPLEIEVKEETDKIGKITTLEKSDKEDDHVTSRDLKEPLFTEISVKQEVSGDSCAEESLNVCKDIDKNSSANQSSICINSPADCDLTANFEELEEKDSTEVGIAEPCKSMERNLIGHFGVLEGNYTSVVGNAKPCKSIKRQKKQGCKSKSKLKAAKISKTQVQKLKNQVEIIRLRRSSSDSNHSLDFTQPSLEPPENDALNEVAKVSDKDLKLEICNTERKATLRRSSSPEYDLVTDAPKVSDEDLKLEIGNPENRREKRTPRKRKVNPIETTEMKKYQADNDSEKLEPDSNDKSFGNSMIAKQNRRWEERLTGMEMSITCEHFMNDETTGMSKSVTDEVDGCDDISVKQQRRHSDRTKNKQTDVVKDDVVRKGRGRKRKSESSLNILEKKITNRNPKQKIDKTTLESVQSTGDKSKTKAQISETNTIWTIEKTCSNETNKNCSVEDHSTYSEENKFHRCLDNSEVSLTSTPHISRGQMKKRTTRFSKVKNIVKPNEAVPKVSKNGTGVSKKAEKENSTDAHRIIVDSTRDDVDEDSSWCNMTLPTPTVGSPMSLPFDANLDLDMCDSSSDSGEDLPEGLTPIKYEKTIHENDLVWVKWKQLPYLPALVKNVYKKKKRLTCVLFAPVDNPEKPFTMSYGNSTSNVVSFCHPRKAEFMKGDEALSGVDKDYFRACIQRMNDFLTKKALKEFKGDIWSFFSQDDLDFSDEEQEDHMDVVEAGDAGDAVTGVATRSDECKIIRVEKEKGPSKKEQLRKQKMNDKTRPLTAFLQSQECKEYLKKIFVEKIKSDLHHVFVNGTTKQRAMMKHRGFGPIDDEEQIESILGTYINWLKELTSNPYLNRVNYVFDVWVPEAIVFALKELHKYCKKKAWEMFNKGVRHSKEELKMMHESLIEKSNDQEEPSYDEDTPVYKPIKLVLR